MPAGARCRVARNPVRSSEDDRLLEPAHLLFGELIGEFERLLDAIGAVGIDEQCGAVADRLLGRLDAPGILAPAREPTFILTKAASFSFDPAAKLGLKFTVRIGGETAAAVDRHAVAVAAQHLEQWQTE